MINPQSQALVSFPVTVDLGPGVPSPRESVWLGFACRLLETKLLQLLRFQFGEARSSSRALSRPTDDISMHSSLG